MTPGRRSLEYRCSLAAVAAVAVGVRAVFWWMTQWTVEDALIVGRTVRNLVEHGELVFNVGDRVSAVTAPLFAETVGLVASAGGDPLIAAKSIGLAAGVATCLLIFDWLCAFAKPLAAAVGALAYTLLPPVIAYSSGGLETPIYTLVSVAAFERLHRGSARTAVTLAALAAVLRPDGALALVVVAVAVMVGHAHEPRVAMRMLWPGIVVPALGYLLHAQYFGTLIPQTVVAKLYEYDIDRVRNFVRWFEQIFRSRKLSLGVYVVAAAGIVLRRDRWRELLPLLSWFVIYATALTVLSHWEFEWYFQPPLAVAGLCAGLAVAALFDGSPALWRRREWRVAAIVAVSTGAAAAIPGLLDYVNERRLTQHYEDTVRADASRWLTAFTPAGTLVFTDSLGYLGYWHELSGGRPGLSVNTRSNLARRPLVRFGFHPLTVHNWRASSVKRPIRGSCCS